MGDQSGTCQWRASGISGAPRLPGMKGRGIPHNHKAISKAFTVFPHPPRDAPPSNQIQHHDVDRIGLPRGRRGGLCPLQLKRVSPRVKGDNIVGHEQKDNVVAGALEPDNNLLQHK